MMMARRKTIASVDAKIEKAKDNLAKAKERYDALAVNLEALLMEKKEICGQVIMDSFMKSERSFEEMMNFLNPNEKR